MTPPSRHGDAFAVLHLLVAGGQRILTHTALPGTTTETALALLAGANEPTRTRQGGLPQPLG